MRDTSYSNISLCVAVGVAFQPVAMLSNLFVPHVRLHECVEVLVHKWLLVTPGIIRTTVLYELIVILVFV